MKKKGKAKVRKPAVPSQRLSDLRAELEAICERLFEVRTIPKYGEGDKRFGSWATLILHPRLRELIAKLLEDELRRNMRAERRRLRGEKEDTYG